MAEDALDAFLKGKPGGGRSRLPGLKVADILTMPPEQQSLVNWLMRHYEAMPVTIAENIRQDIAQVQTSLKTLTDQGFLKTIEKPGGTYYRVKLAPKSGRQMPTDVWQVLDNASNHANVFISYSRRNKEFVQELHSALEATGREVWVDWENIPVAVDWWKEIQLGIELADTFVFVLSPDSIASQVCGQEIEEALTHNKRLVPVVCQDVPPQDVHPELARLNWIFLRPQDDFEKGFKGLLEALDRDLDYVRTHTRILVRALEWDRNGRDASYLLRGTDLERANRYLAQGKAQEPRPSALHHQYVLASADREASDRALELERQKAALSGQRRLLQLVTAASILAVAMGLSSWMLSQQSQRAQKLAEEARIRSLNQSAQSLLLADKPFESLLSATQAGRLFQALDTEQQTASLQADLLSSLQQALLWVQERNRLEGHTGTIWQVAFSPDEQTLASASADGTLRLWQLDGQQVAVLKSSGSPLLDLDYAPDGKFLVAIDAAGELYRWEATSGNLLGNWQAHTHPTRAVTFSPGGDRVATASEDGTVKVWTLTGDLVQTLADKGAGFQALVWTAQNQLLAGDSQGQVFLWGEDLQPIATWQSPLGAAITALDVNPAGTQVAVSSRDRQLLLLDLATPNAPIKTFPTHAGTVYNVRFTPDGQQLVTVGDDKTIQVWQLDGTPAGTLVGHRGLVSALALSPTGKQLATAGGDRTLRLWDWERSNLKVLQKHQGAVNAVAVAPEGDLMASGGKDARIHLWDSNGNWVRSLSDHTDAIQNLVFSPDGNLLVSTSQDGTVRLWSSLRSDAPSARVLQGHRGAVHGVAIHPQGDLLATVGADKTLRLWNLNGELLTTLDAHRDQAVGVAFSPDGQFLATTGWDYEAKIWPMDTIGKVPPRVLTGHRGWVLDATFSPDSQILATASYDNTVKLWQVSDGRLITTLEGHEDGVQAIAFSRDGQQIFTASNDNTIRVWSLSGTPLTTLSGHVEGVRDIALDHQNQRLLSASGDGTVLMWHWDEQATMEVLLNKSCQWLRNYLQANPNLNPEEKRLCEVPPTP